MIGDFDNNLHKGYICTGTRAILYFILHKSIFLHYVHHGTKCYDKYINTDDTKNIDDDESSVFPKQRDRNPYNAKYQVAYGDILHVLSTPNITDARIRRVYSRIKRKSTGFVYTQGSPYHDAEGYPQLR